MQICISRRSAALAVTVALLACGCSSQPTSTTTSGARSPSESATSPEPSPSREELYWAQFEEIVDRPSVDLAAAPLPSPPRAFSEAEVAALAAYAIDLVPRTFDRRLSGLEPDAALRWVLEGQPPSTGEAFQALVAEKLGPRGGWLAATRYEQPRRNRIIAARWSARSAAHPDGPILILTLQAVGSAHAPDGTGTDRPVIVQRTVTYSSSNPGDPSWEPGLGMYVRVHAVDVCHLLDTSLIRPVIPKPRNQDRMLATVRRSVEADRVLPDEPDGDTLANPPRDC